MKTIQVIGTGCPKCKQLAENAQAAIAGLESDYQIEKVTDINAIMSMGVMVTPALAIDGDVKAIGKVLGADEIKNLLA